MRTISPRASSARAASTSREVAGSKAADRVPARAGPTIRAELKLVVSSALAGVRSSSGTIDGIRLVKPPNDSG